MGNDFVAGKRFAIFGLGRSGLGVAKAVKELGGHAHVFDQKPRESLSKPDLADEADRLGTPLTFDWDGTLDGTFDYLVLNPAIDKRLPILKTFQIPILSEIEFAYRIARAPMVAITGTNGKSTTTVMTYECLRACGETPILCGNIFGSGYPEMSLTEAALVATEDQTLVAEVSSFQLEWVQDFRPVSAGITNIWPDHLDRYDSFREYAETKARIFDCMGSEDTVVVKANDPVVTPPGGAPSSYRSRRLRLSPGSQAGQSGPLVLTFGATERHARVEERELIILNRRILLSDLPFNEPHNYTNAAMAALLAYGLLRFKAQTQPDSATAELLRRTEMEEREALAAKRSVYDLRITEEQPMLVLPATVIEGLKNFKGLAHRMELIGEKNEVRVINNSMCTNPDAVIKSAQAVRDPVHLLIGGLNKGLDFGPLRNYLANRKSRAYLFGTSRSEIDQMLGGGYPEVETMEEAFNLATEAALPKQVIMLAPGCASTDQFRDFRDRGDVFRDIASRWLNS